MLIVRRSNKDRRKRSRHFSSYVGALCSGSVEQWNRKLVDYLFPFVVAGFGLRFFAADFTCFFPP